MSLGNLFRNAWGRSDLKSLWPDEYADLYAAHREVFIQGAYSADTADRGGSNETAAAIDEVYKYAEDPKFEIVTDANRQDLLVRTRRFHSTMRNASAKDPEKRGRLFDRLVRDFYRIQDHVDFLTGTHSLLEVADRFQELRRQYATALHGKKGETLAGLQFIASYEFRILHNRYRCRAIKQLQDEGLINLEGIKHESVMADVEQFDRNLYTRWESGLVVNDGGERKLEYRRFLRSRARVWLEEYEKITDGSGKR